jgi:flavodoxin I
MMYHTSMRIYIVYATYSNSTQFACEVLTTALQEAGHQVRMELANLAQATDIAQAELVILASPSWDYDSKEGQPHEDFLQFFSAIDSTVLAQKPYAVLGTGDSNYTYFCGAVDILTQQLNSADAVQYAQPLKLDQYYLNEAACHEQIKTWARAFSPANE